MAEIIPGMIKTVAGLEVFDGSEDLSVYFYDHRDAAANHNVFLRLCRYMIRASDPISPEEFVAMADEHFDILQTIGITAVPHEWGLVPVEAAEQYEGFNPRTHMGVPETLMPPGYLLAARVHSVEPTHPAYFNPTTQLPCSGVEMTDALLALYRQELAENNILIGLCDVRPEWNSMVGNTRYGSLKTPPSEECEGERQWLIDIEPFFRPIDDILWEM